ncbi:hypothetical protein T06_14319, partial [Trichinella sp. T6]
LVFGRSRGGPTCIFRHFKTIFVRTSQKSGKILPLASSIRISNVQASSVIIMVVSTIGIQLIWTARLLDSQSKPTVDDIKVVNKINDRAHHDRFPLMTAACKLFPHILASARTQRQVIAFDKSLSAINCSAVPEISRCSIFLLVRETKSTASCGPVSRRISTTSFRMKKLCDAVSKRINNTFDYPHYIRLISSLHTVSNKLLEMRSHWQPGLLCRTVEITKCWRQNLIRFLVCELHKSQDDQLSYDYPMSIVSRS